VSPAVDSACGDRSIRPAPPAAAVSLVATLSQVPSVAFQCRLAHTVRHDRNASVRSFRRFVLLIELGEQVPRIRAWTIAQDRTRKYMPANSVRLFNCRTSLSFRTRLSAPRIEPEIASFLNPLT